MRTASSIGKLRLAVEPRAQRLALDERHHVVEQPVRLARVEQRQDVRMLQVRRDLDLGEEPLDPSDGAELGIEHLERDLAVVPEVVARGRPSPCRRADLALDRVATDECGVELGGGAHLRLK